MNHRLLDSLDLICGMSLPPTENVYLSHSDLFMKHVFIRMKSLCRYLHCKCIWCSNVSIMWQQDFYLYLCQWSFLEFSLRFSLEYVMQTWYDSERSELPVSSEAFHPLPPCPLPEWCLPRTPCHHRNGSKEPFLTQPSSLEFFMP